MQYELKPGLELEEKNFQDLIFPKHVVNHVWETMKVQEQIAAGNRNPRKLIEYVFFLRHPALAGKAKPFTEDKYKAEREAIFFNVVAPTLNAWEPPVKPAKAPAARQPGKDLDEIWRLTKWFLKHAGR
jgi:hypothetical protein